MTNDSSRSNVLRFNRAAASDRVTESVEQNGFASDIFHNPELKPPAWHFIISRVQSSEILYWGQERSLEQAQAASRAVLASLTATSNLG
jgi:hypothetical protein